VTEPYEFASLDALDRLRSTDGSLTLLPLRRTVGFRPFGVNAWIGERRGDLVIERHEERGGDEELYVVVRGRATFTVGEETVDAAAGTLVHVSPGTLREAVAAEDDTLILAAGAKPGEAWAPKPWEDFYVAFAWRAAGRSEEARALVDEALSRDPDAWQGAYNAACFEALEGNADAAFDQLRKAHERAAATIERFAPEDADLAALHDDPRWRELFG
jgi:tetratricopeptide (TPR) repeat protein